jgi:hypothetical protein
MPYPFILLGIAQRAERRRRKNRKKPGATQESMSLRLPPMILKKPLAKNHPLAD